MLLRGKYFVFFLFLFLQQISSHRCIHDDIVAEEIAAKRSIAIADTKRQTGPPLPIRVVIDSSSLDSDPDICVTVGQIVNTDSAGSRYTCTANDILTPAKRNFLQQLVIPQAIEKFADLLNVTRVSGPLTLPSTSCGCGGRPSVPVPSSYTGTNGAQDADIVVFLTGRPTFNGTIAWACPCMYQSGGRPISGFINWGPNSIDSAPINYPSQFGVGVHEMTHVLGFTGGSYASYATGPNIVKNVVRTAGGLSHNVSIITTPKLLQVVRDHYACPDLDGLELENGGGAGTAGSHWEKRLAQNEYMTGTSSSDPVFSILTLALLEDSGWYYPNYEHATEFLWGKGQGCNFVYQRCNQWQRPYTCDANLQGADWDCTFDNRKKGVCNIRNVTASSQPTDPWYDYYSNPNAFGSDSYADYCGFIAAQKTWDCTVPQNANITFAKEAYGEHYCPTCRCMQTMQGNVRIPSCHNFTCVNGVLKVQIGSIWYNCVTNKQQITISTGYDGGYYICPADSATQCSGVADDPNDVWPSFMGVWPIKGRPGSAVNITVLNLTDVAQVTFGPQHGCYEPSITLSQNGSSTIISCLIGQLKSAVIILEEVSEVDVSVIDSQGRSAAGIKAYTLDTSSAMGVKAHWIFVVVAVFVCAFVM